MRYCLCPRPGIADPGDDLGVRCLKCGYPSQATTRIRMVADSRGVRRPALTSKGKP